MKAKEANMKICYISTKSIHTRRWVEYFVGSGREVHLITQEYDTIEGIKIYEVNPKASKLSPLFKAIIIRNLVKKINKRWIKDSENGFIVPAKDPETLAEKVIYLLENEDIRKKFGEANRRLIEEKADYYKEMEKVENNYMELVERYKT